MKNISEKLFGGFMVGLCVLVFLSILPSIMSMYDYCVIAGFTKVWSICIPAVTDLMILIGHVGAVWLGVRGEKVGRLMLLVYLGAAASIAVNLLHAPQTGPSVSLMGSAIYATQVIGMLPPVFLLVSSNAALYIIELKLHGARIAQEREEREARANEMKTLKLSAKDTTLKAIEEGKAKGLTIEQIAKRAGVSTSTVHRKKALIKTVKRPVRKPGPTVTDTVTDTVTNTVTDTVISL